MNNPASPVKNGVKVMALGDYGSGKTYSAILAARAGLNVNLLFTEPGMSTLDAMPEDVRKLIGTKIHYMYRPAAGAGLTALADMAKKVNSLSYEALSSVVSKKSDTAELLPIIDSLREFKSDIDGTVLGSPLQWDSNTLFVLDSLSGLSLAMLRCVVGTKPIIAPGEWNIAMRMLEDFINTLCFGTRCHVAVTAHPEVEIDEVTGKAKGYPSAIGKKLAPKLGRYFDEIFETKYEGGKYLWSTVSNRLSLKRRNLPLSEKIEPDWKLLIKS